MTAHVFYQAAAQWTSLLKCQHGPAMAKHLKFILTATRVGTKLWTLNKGERNLLFAKSTEDCWKKLLAICPYTGSGDMMLALKASIFDQTWTFGPTVSDSIFIFIC